MGEEKKAFSDFEKMKLLSNLKIRMIKKKEFFDAMKILSKELGNERVRNNNFLYKKFKEYPKFFIGAFLDNEIIGVICGFPREDYLLISEIAIDLRFHKRGFGKKLVEEFEKNIHEEYNRIHVGADDNAIKFYESLPGYVPFLLIQFKRGDYSDEIFNKLRIIKKYNFDKRNIAIEIKIKKTNFNSLKKLRKKYPKAWFQYIFVKKI